MESFHISRRLASVSAARQSSTPDTQNLTKRVQVEEKYFRHVMNDYNMNSRYPLLQESIWCCIKYLSISWQNYGYQENGSGSIWKEVRDSRNQNRQLVPIGFSCGAWYK